MAPKETVYRVARFGPFMHVGFAQDDGAGVFQTGHDRSVEIGYPIGKYLRPCCRSDAVGCEVVLDSDWNPMKRTPVSSRIDLAFRDFRLRSSVSSAVTVMYAFSSGLSFSMR